MLNTTKALLIGMLVLGVQIASLGQSSGSKNQPASLVMVFKDGHRQTLPVADTTRIEFKSAEIVVFEEGRQQSFPLRDLQSFEFDTSATSGFPSGRNHFLGKWKVGDGAGGHFFITLEADGHASKTIGGHHGNWTVVNGEARIIWEDGWHDVIRKVGAKHEKVAFPPGKSFSDEPDNVTDAVNTTAEPI